MIVSASRRTDIPCHYAPWLMERLRAGYALTRNPMNHAQVRRVSMKPEDVDAFVFWTKDPLALMAHLDELDRNGYAYYFQFTLTPYGRGIEPGLRDKAEIERTFAALSRRIGRERVLWRYDPIVLGGELTAQYHREQFSRLCEALGPHTERVTVSFVDLYAKLRTDAVRAISMEEMEELAAFIGEKARAHGLLACACCERADFSRHGIGRAACVDAALVRRISGREVSARPDQGQRAGCGCAQSMDIGAYDTCPNGCVYCYANRSAAAVAKNRARHSPASPFLVGEAPEA